MSIVFGATGFYCYACCLLTMWTCCLGDCCCYSISVSSLFDFFGVQTRMRSLLSLKLSMMSYSWSTVCMLSSTLEHLLKSSLKLVLGLDWCLGSIFDEGMLTWTSKFSSRSVTTMPVIGSSFPSSMSSRRSSLISLLKSAVDSYCDGSSISSWVKVCGSSSIRSLLIEMSSSLLQISSTSCEQLDDELLVLFCLFYLRCSASRILSSSSSILSKSKSIASSCLAGIVLVD